ISWAPASRRGAFLNCRLAVNGIQKAARSFGIGRRTGTTFMGIFSSKRGSRRGRGARLTWCSLNATIPLHGTAWAITITGGNVADEVWSGVQAPSRKTRAGEANAERILDAALEIFAAFGFRGSRIDQIAAAAGLSKPNLLYYFRTKEELYTAVLARTLDMWLDPLRELDASSDPRAALTAYITRKLEYSRSHPTASRLFAMEMLQGAPHL